MAPHMPELVHPDLDKLIEKGMATNGGDTMLAKIVGYATVSDPSK
jgi:hypothetical protein